jgi:hypothetical membrane protein
MLMYTGAVSCVSLVLIGIFDEKMWSQVHNVVAFTFFLSFGAYAYMLGNLLYANRERYPKEEQEGIEKV